jgi:hypothetical protein
MIIKEMFHIPMKLKSELVRASMTTSDVNNQRGEEKCENTVFIQVLLSVVHSGLVQGRLHEVAV